MGSVAASGGYYIAAATDRIVANPGTLTGSIGVIMETANVEGLLQKIGVEGVVIKSGKYKDVGSPLRKMSADERGLMQEVMDDVHKQFIEAVARGRSLELTDVQALADGRIFTGRQAKEARLVDELGDLEDAIQLAAEVAGIEGEPKVIEPRRRFSLREILSQTFRDVPEAGFSPRHEHEISHGLLTGTHVEKGRPLSAMSEGGADMTKAQIIEKVSEQVTTLTKRQAEVVVNTIFDCVRDSLKNGDKTEIRGFGSFRLRARRMKEGRNPKTGATVAVPAKRVPFFKAGKELKELLNQ